jgi:diadenosine tetraphosphatase ApaH/serine/threonine PP2A family protein phosphatase
LRELDEGIAPNMNPVAMEALHFTDKALSRDNRDWLLSLPDKLAIEDSFYLFHGSPSDPDEYIFDPFEAAYAFKSLVSDYPVPANLLCFIGHTHICAAYAFDAESHRVGEKAVSDRDKFHVKPGAHYMFNAGSCGQYRGGLPIATLCVMDTDEMTVEFCLLRYDVAATQEKIISAGLPPLLARRLAIGQ